MNTCRYLLFDDSLASAPRARLRKTDLSLSDACAVNSRTTNSTSFTTASAISMSFFFVAWATHHDNPTSNKTNPVLEPFLKLSHSSGSTGIFFNGGQLLRPTRILGSIDMYQDFNSVPNFSTWSMGGGEAMSPEDFAHLERRPGRNP